VWVAAFSQQNDVENCIVVGSWTMTFLNHLVWLC